jgi:hypothetical protein
MKITNQQIIPSLFLVIIIVIIGLWIGLGNNVQKIPVPDYGYPNTTVTTVLPVQTFSCHGNLYSIQSGGIVYLGEGCLNVTAAISSEQVISWYKNGRKTGNESPDARRIVHDARNFYVNPDEYQGFEGNWYVGTTDKVAFVVRDVTLDTKSVTSGKDANASTAATGSSGDEGMFDVSVLKIINSTNKIDYARVWVVLEDPPETQKISLPDLTFRQKPDYREQQRAHYLNLTKPVVDYVRDKGYIVDYIGQTTPSIEVLAPPPFMEDLAKQPTVRKIVVPKTSPQLIKEMLQKKSDETITADIFLSSPSGIVAEPESPRTEQQMREYYAKNRILFQIHTRSVLERLNSENISILYPGPYPMSWFHGDYPVHLLEEFNSRSDVVLIQLDIPYRII